MLHRESRLVWEVWIKGACAKVKKRSGLRKALCAHIIMREWVENGEFNKADTIMVIGTKLQAMMVRLLFFGKGKRICFCTGPQRRYVHDDRVKWIVLDSRSGRMLPGEDFNILRLPEV